ncbi:MAG: AMP-binding protein [Pyrinomonadaceae bacterium]
MNTNAPLSGSFVEFERPEIEHSIPERFARLAREHHGRVAIKTEGRAFTYAELNGIVDCVARAILSRRGAGEEPVALLLRQGAAMIAVILGALRAGKICVPLDPSFPRERTAYVLSDSQAGLVVTDDEHLPLAAELNLDASRLLNVDDLDRTLAGDFCPPVSPGAFALIMYTSGSTGQPKGVVQSHRSVLHNIRFYTNGFRIRPTDRMTLLPSCSVQSGMTNLLCALLNGATLYPFDVKEEALAPLADLLSRERITIYHSAPTVFRHFAGGLSGTESFPEMRIIQLSSERVLARDVELYRRHFPDTCLLHVGLGATETTGCFRQHWIDQRTRIAGVVVVPVGYAVEGKHVLLLDDVGEEVGPGHVGEIAVKSRYLSHGYWRKPELTKSFFSPTSASVRHNDGERIYRTGDLGRLHVDGCLEHVGRKDFQIKIRGLRIEAAEVEGALLGVRGIKEAVVTARENPHGDQCLIAYLVLDHEHAPAAGEMSRLLSDKLPAHMVPTNFVVLDSLPLTPNGKVNRLALPVPDREQDELLGTYEAPRTETEAGVAAIWADLLLTKHVGRHANFFEMGGHSLLAVRFISRVRERYGVELPLRSLFDTPTVVALAAAIDKSRA